MRTTYEQIINIADIASLNSKENISQLISLAKAELISPASEDKKRTLLLAIDVQNDFMEGIGTLPVTGSKKDVERLTRWIYNNLEGLTQIMCSLDTHSITQIFHADWWIDKDGNNPAPFTIITYSDVKEGKWEAANGEKYRSLVYLENLEKKGKKQLCIWPYHCLEGTKGAELESEFTKMLYFHSAARSSTAMFVAKGQNPFTEMYGIIKAEYDSESYINQTVLDTIEQFDDIYIAGEASSHCVLASLEQILEYFSENKELTSRITLLEDCMSPIAGFEESTLKQFEVLKTRYGIQVRKSTDVVL